MDIKFQTRKLEKNFGSALDLKKAYGPQMAKTITDKIKDLQKAQNLAELLTSGRVHRLHLNRDGQYAMVLVHPHRLVFEPNHTPLPRTEDGGVDAGQVTKIMVVEVKDYH